MRQRQVNPAYCILCSTDSAVPSVRFSVQSAHDIPLGHAKLCARKSWDGNTESMYRQSCLDCRLEIRDAKHRHPSCYTMLHKLKSLAPGHTEMTWNWQTHAGFVPPIRGLDRPCCKALRKHCKLHVMCHSFEHVFAAYPAQRTRKSCPNLRCRHFRTSVPR